ncbi:MAG: hypothetical protein JO345_34460 [Streptosporangiaceae bacterium]|nr:hypothetical protein [Streptosporangiaceae bacterium]
MASVQQTDAWACLKQDWGGAYRFEYWPGTQKSYRAFRRDDGTELSAETPQELRELIRADHLRNPVSLETAP